jgi:hypothetical protein
MSSASQNTTAFATLEHLTDDFPAYPRVCGALDLDEGRDPVLIEQHVVDAPDIAFIAGERDLTRHEQPPPWRGGIDQLAREQLRMRLEQPLK